MFDWLTRLTRRSGGEGSAGTAATTGASSGGAAAGGGAASAGVGAGGAAGAATMAAGVGTVGGIAVPQLLALVAVAVGVLAVAGTGLFYLITRQPLTTLPGIAAVGKQLPPRYAASVLGSSRPIGIAVTPDGSRIYVVQTGGERLTVVYDRKGQVVGKLAPPDTQEGRRLPMYAALDAAGRLYVTDRLRQVVDVYSPTGAYLMALVLLDGSGQAVIPLGISYAGRDSSGQELLAITEGNDRSHRVLLTTLDGTVVRAYGDAEGPGQLSYPNAAALDRRGRLFVGDGNNNRIAVFGEDGRFAAAFGTGDKEGSVGVPRGLYLDRQGRLHIVDMSSHQVVVYDVSAQPTYLYSFGDYGVGNGELNYPAGIAGDGAGRLYIADTQTGRVQIWAY